MTTATTNVGRLQIWAENFEKRTADFAAWTVDNSGITRIVSREKLIDCNEAETTPAVQTTAQKAKKIAVAFFTGFALLIPAIIGFTAHQITTGLSKAWEFIAGKSSNDDEESADDVSETASVRAELVTPKQDEVQKEIKAGSVDGSDSSDKELDEALEGDLSLATRAPNHPEDAGL